MRGTDYIVKGKLFESASAYLYCVGMIATLFTVLGV